jgi:L-cystine uptake protein TcyP (sodium:dicarboxylate symporter family)
VKSVVQQNSHLEIDLANPDDTTAVVGFLITAGVQITEVHRDQASLEEAFLRMMEEDTNGQ